MCPVHTDCALGATNHETTKRATLEPEHGLDLDKNSDFPNNVHLSDKKSRFKLCRSHSDSSIVHLADREDIKISLDFESIRKPTNHREPSIIDKKPTIKQKKTNKKISSHDSRNSKDVFPDNIKRKMQSPPCRLQNVHSFSDGGTSILKIYPEFGKNQYKIYKKI